jgi:hypothetical protein
VNYTKTIVVGLFLVGLSIAGWGQTQGRPSASGIPGFLDPNTGTFKPIPAVSSSENAPVVTPTKGRIVLSLVAGVRSALPSNEVYTCGISVSTFDATSTLAFEESAQIAATPSGLNEVCVITLPYSWDLTSPGSDTMSISYSVTAVGPTNGLPARQLNHGVANIPVPANGATTTFSLTTYI